MTNGIIALQATNVDYWYGEGESAKQVLFDNNLAVKQGEIVIMTGPSGSGKTTLLTLIGTLRSVQSGSITFFERELRGRTRAEQNELRKDIGFIFQHHNLFESLSARDTLRVAMELRPERVDKDQAYKEADAMLERLGLGARVGYKPASLSGGQKQRVAIARALINRPKLILADEPTAALDQESGQTVVDVFKDLAQNHGTTVLIVTHDHRILDAADRIVNMLDGHIHSNVLIKEHIRLCDILNSLAVFKDTRPSVLNDLVHHLHKEIVPAGTTIIREGDIGDKFYILDRGEARVLIERNGQQEVSSVLKDGSAFGELALLRDAPRAATVITNTESQIYSLAKQEFLAVVSDPPSLAKELMALYM
jgi:putative ABC transport system ATP-binding protein